ncbi:LysR family transcriptional regulator [Limosilactobacillus fermentum]|uniref:LysR family transcriptional regulator n=1 Tax=Limosilactobacillus fermentum TaxID=1613 RepID=UPI001075B77E|nr:LysR family transcriptional regulator [Limosilactobacillus fermentum]TFZ18871.1 LysR family transcriptional regulator [Limosilactobacillus fermentum]
MIENYLLEELVTFQRMGTLQKTAAHLAVTQPTVTRGMQKLEDELGVKLFDRHPNRLELTAAGELAAKEAAAVLRRQELMVNRVQNFVAQNQALTIGAVVPGPLIILKRLAGAPLFNHQVDERLVEPERVPEELTNDRLGMVFTTTDLTGPDLISQPLGVEHLFVNLDHFLPQTNQTAVSFKDLAGLSFVVLDDIGAWKDVIGKEIEDAHFMYQDERDAMDEIARYSGFPYFTTNVTAADPSYHPVPANNRVERSIKGLKAELTIYVTVKRRRQNQVQPLVDRLKAAWAKLPTTPTTGGTNVLK